MSVPRSPYLHTPTLAHTPYPPTTTTGEYLREEEEEEKKKEKKSGSNSTRDSETIANQEAGDPQVNLGALVVELAGLRLRR
ncbi:hypothetical protein Pmani_005462 [Petrolisthes manimaculis]|uniref:Uncharacterized protein n=1 Tax=Petrolisthes manimaculis TaxID=1843537 RepID=A0AAE1UHF4_9EUCA|nr:hypothetical protein Pmani_005462 [Petrolisthes manimaculis]